MSSPSFNEFFGALEFARDHKQITRDEFRDLDMGIHAKFDGELDAVKKEALRVKYLALIVARDWTTLRALVLPRPTALRSFPEQAEYDAMSPDGRAEADRQAGRDGNLNYAPRTVAEQAQYEAMGPDAQIAEDIRTRRLAGSTPAPFVAETPDPRFGETPASRVGERTTPPAPSRHR